MEITSRENSTFKDLLKLTDKKWRRRMGLCIIEGEKIVRDNLHRVEQVIARSSRRSETHVCKSRPSISKPIASRREAAYPYPDSIVFSDSLFNLISSLENDTGILATVKVPEPRETTSPFLVLDGIQDPGNMGTLLRTAAAFGFNTVFCIDCVDVWSPKVLRASSGVQFGLNIVETSEFVKPDGCVLIGADCHSEPQGHTEARNLGYAQTQREPEILRRSAPLNDKFGIVLGSEGRGLSERVKGLVDKFVTIPMHEGVESLNVAVAGGILMYELTLADSPLR